MQALICLAGAALVCARMRTWCLHMRGSILRSWRVQIVMTVNKEAVLSEKQLSAHFGQTIMVAYSEPLSPEGHATPESFFAACSAGVGRAVAAGLQR